MNVLKVILKEKEIVGFILCELLMIGFAPIFWVSQRNAFNAILLALLIVVGSYSLYLLYKITKKFDQQSKENAQKEILLKQKDIQNQHILATMQMTKDLDELKMKVQRELYDQDITSTQQIDDYIKSHYESIFMFFTDNKIVDAIVYNKVMLMKKLHIKYSIDLVIPSQLKIDNIVLISVLGNLLDNAIEACEAVKFGKRFVNLKMRLNQGYLSIEVQNSCIDNKTIEKGKSTKREKEEHGIGLKIIEKYCLEYNGLFETNISNQQVSSYVSLKCRD
ncbi:MAG: ATP-binding protein [Floccifex sp.]